MDYKFLAGIMASALIGIGVVMVAVDMIDRRLPGNEETIRKDIAVVAALEKQNLELIEAVKTLAKYKAGVSNQTLCILAATGAIAFIIVLKMLLTFKIRREEIRFGIAAPAGQIPHHPQTMNNIPAIDYTNMY